MAKIGDVQPLGTSLERSYEVYVRGRLKFRVGQLVYVAFSLDESVMGFAFPKEERAALVAGEPGTFLMPAPADERFNWVRVRMSAIDADEMRELVTEAWRMVVPKKVAAERLGEGTAPRATAEAVVAPALADLRETVEVFNGFANVDRSWLTFRELTHPAVNLSRAEHREALHRWLNSWGCRIRYPREGEPDLFDSGLAAWWNTWGERLPSESLAELGDKGIRTLAHAYAAMAATPVSAGRVTRSLGPTAAGKALYALRPPTVIPWDAAIAQRLYGARDTEAFARHLTLGRTWARSVLAEAQRPEGAVPELLGRPSVPLSKILDEYLYVRYSMKD